MLPPLTVFLSQIPNSVRRWDVWDPKLWGRLSVPPASLWWSLRACSTWSSRTDTHRGLAVGHIELSLALGFTEFVKVGRGDVASRKDQCCLGSMISGVCGHGLDLKLCRFVVLTNWMSQDKSLNFFVPLREGKTSSSLSGPLAGAENSIDKWTGEKHRH